MLELFADKEQELDFEVQIEGASPDNVDAVFKIKLGKIEIGFPATVESGSISVSIPRLRSVLRSEFKKPIKGTAVLETVIEGCYKVPWSDKVLIKRDVQVEAKLATKKVGKRTPTIKARIKRAGKTSSKQKKIEQILEKVLD